MGHGSRGLSELGVRSEDVLRNAVYRAGSQHPPERRSAHEIYVRFRCATIRDNIDGL